MDQDGNFAVTGHLSGRRAKIEAWDEWGWPESVATVAAEVRRAVHRYMRPAETQEEIEESEWGKDTWFFCEKAHLNARPVTAFGGDWGSDG